MFDRIRQVSPRSSAVRKPAGQVASGVAARLATFMVVASLAMIFGSNAGAQFAPEQGCPPGREWVQTYACAEGDGDGDGDGGGEATAQSGQAEVAFTRQSGLVAGLRRSLLSHSSDAPYYSLRDGKGNGFDFFLHGVYAFDERNTNEFFATLRVVDVRSGAMMGFSLGAVGVYVYLGPIDTFEALR